VLEEYEDAGGSYRELVFAECGHSPHLEHPAEFVEALVELIRS
jgi:pimeloyl-ACP methyl ester carboxylesterase